MKKINTKMRLMRPADGYLPLAFLVAAALGHSTAAEQTFMNMLFPGLFALATARGLRLAFAEQPSMRRVAGSVKLALPLQFIGALAFFVIDLIKNRGQFIAANAIYIAAGMLLNIEHVFYEYLYATGESGSATRLRAITAALTCAGIMMTTEARAGGLLPHNMEWLLGGAALSAGLGAFIGRSIGGKMKGKVNNRVLRCAPMAMIQSAIYPVAWLLALLLLQPIMFDSLTAVPFFLGLTVYELSRTPFRRSRMESKGFNIAMLIVALLGGLLIASHYVPAAQSWLNAIPAGWGHEIPAAGVMLAAAAVCAFGMYGNIGNRAGDL